MRNDCKNYSQTQLSFLPPLSCVMSLCKSWNAQRLVHLFQSRIILSQLTNGPQRVSPQRLLPKLSVHHGRQLSIYGAGLHVSLHPTTHESKPPPVIPHSSALSELNATSNHILHLIILMSSVMFPENTYNILTIMFRHSPRTFRLSGSPSCIEMTRRLSPMFGSTPSLL